VTGAITVPTPGDIISACFGSSVAPFNPPASAATSPACTNIRRNPISSQLDGSPADTPGLFGVLSNNGKITTDGVDLTADYRHGLGTIMGTPAKFALNFGGNWTHSQKFQATPTSVNRECVGFYSANCGFPAGGLLPKYTWNMRTTLSLGRTDLSVLWRHLSAMRYEPGLPPLFSGTVVSGPSTSVFFSDPGNFNGKTVDFNHIPAFNYFDFATRFNVNEHFDLTFTVMNILDKKPPIVGNTAGTTSQNSGNTFPSTYDPLGRRFAAGARIKF
jgi:outer membrane receptor protein involved in Fe transport